MKKQFIFIFLLSFLFISQAMSQGTRFGVKAGANFSNFRGDGLDDFDLGVATNFHGGLFLEFMATPGFSLQPELLLTTVGSRLRSNTTQMDFDNLHTYVSIPVLVRVYLIPDVLSVDFGPQMSFLTSQRSNVNVTDSRTFDFALAGGVTAHILGPIFIQARYVAGMTEIKRDAEVKHAVVQLSAGFRF